MGINKEIFRDLYKVNAGMIDIWTVESYEVLTDSYLNVQWMSKPCKYYFISYIGNLEKAMKQRCTKLKHAEKNWFYLRKIAVFLREYLLPTTTWK